MLTYVRRIMNGGIVMITLKGVLVTCKWVSIRNLSIPEATPILMFPHSFYFRRNLPACVAHRRRAWKEWDSYRSLLPLLHPLPAPLLHPHPISITLRHRFNDRFWSPPRLLKSVVCCLVLFSSPILLSRGYPILLQKHYYEDFEFLHHWKRKL